MHNPQMNLSSLRRLVNGVNYLIMYQLKLRFFDVPCRYCARIRQGTLIFRNYNNLQIQHIVCMTKDRRDAAGNLRESTRTTLIKHFAVI